MAKKRGAIIVSIKETHYFPGETRYVMQAEVPDGEDQFAIVVRDYENNVKLSKESKVHPYVGRMMVREILDHIARVNLD